MSFEEAPPLPGFLAARLPFTRTSYRLERGAYAGRGIHFIDHGPRDRPAALLLHGNPTWSFLWRDVVARLPDRRCVAPDLLGFGLSDRLPRLADHRLDDHVEAIAELVERLALRDLVLVGQDWGGPIACGVGARLPDRIRAVVLANTSVLVPARPRGTAFHRFARLPLLSDLVFRGLNFPVVALARVQGDRRSIRGDVARAYAWPFPSWSSRAAPLAFARMVPDGPRHPAIPELRRGETWLRSFAGPVHLVWGEADPILGRALARHQRELPRARVTRTAAGHFLQEEVPEALAVAVAAASAAAASQFSGTGTVS